MATRSMQFFMTTTEIELLVREISEKQGLMLILSRRSPAQLEIADQRRGLKMVDGQLADQIFLSPIEPDLTAIDMASLRPGELGWVQIDVPRSVGNVLYSVQMGAKSDWFDEKEQRVAENPASLDLYSKVLPHFKKYLKSPCFARNVMEGGRCQEYPSIRYSKGAEDWERGGGELCQEGVENVRFSTAKPAADKV